VEPNNHWQEIAEDRDRWQYVYLAVWSGMAETKEKNTFKLYSYTQVFYVIHRTGL